VLSRSLSVPLSPSLLPPALASACNPFCCSTRPHRASRHNASKDILAFVSVGNPSSRFIRPQCTTRPRNPACFCFGKVSAASNSAVNIGSYMESLASLFNARLHSESMQDSLEVLHACTVASPFSRSLLVAARQQPVLG
jgi:hypothetical protein